MATITTTVSGDNVIAYQNVQEFTPSEVLEQTIVLNNASKVIDYSYIDNPTVFLFKADNAFTVSITAGGVTLPIIVEGEFRFSTTNAFTATITEISVAETNSVDTSITIKAYNQA